MWLGAELEVMAVVEQVQPEPGPELMPHCADSTQGQG
jgi:hypothetical protein